MNESRRAFLLGRMTSRTAEIVVVDGGGSPPIPGPWKLRALIRVAEAHSPTLPWSSDELS